MAVMNSRAGKLIRATRAYRFFGRDRETITEAYAGDIIGLVNPGQFAIGDTVHTGAPLRFLQQHFRVGPVDPWLEGGRHYGGVG
jgi:peptide chain release factor 3